MDDRVVIGIILFLVGASLVGAPITMVDWQEQAVIATERVDDSSFDEELPRVHFENLSGEARRAIERTMSSPDGSVTIYGSADRPEEFVYSSDYVAPGHGQYGLLYEGEQYVLRTYAPDSWGIAFWLYIIPVMFYGVLLAWVGFATAGGQRSERFGMLAAVPGVAFHVLGPAFDFPLIGPDLFVGFVVLVTGTLVVGLLVVSDE